MNEEQTEQTVEAAETTETTQSTEPETIGDIAKKYNVEEQAQNFQQEVPQPVEQHSDPYNYDYDQALNEMRNVVNEVKTYKEQIQNERMENDIKQAVAKIDVEGVSDKFKRVYLETEYHEDPNFKKIWDLRYANPRAYEEALKFHRNQVAKMFNVKSDPQLVENQQAAKKSQRTVATAAPADSLTDQMMNASGSDFDEMWERMRGRGN